MTKYLTFLQYYSDVGVICIKFIKKYFCSLIIKNLKKKVIGIIKSKKSQSLRVL